MRDTASRRESIMQVYLESQKSRMVRIMQLSLMQEVRDMMPQK